MFYGIYCLQQKSVVDDDHFLLVSTVLLTFLFGESVIVMASKFDCM